MINLREKLHDKNYKLTPQRQQILDVFTAHRDKHLSADEVHRIVRRYAPEIGLATVYRTLEILVGIDILKRLDFGDGLSRYEINIETSHHHHHLICKNCGVVKEFEEDLLETLETVISRKSSFTITDHEVKFFRYCQESQKRCDGN